MAMSLLCVKSERFVALHSLSSFPLIFHHCLLSTGERITKQKNVQLEKVFKKWADT